MNIVEFKNVRKAYFSQKLYEHVDLEINSDEKIAIIGNNGTGKSTIIRMITGEEVTDRGRVIKNEDAVIRCFDQFGSIDMEANVEDLLYLPFKEVIAVQAEMDNLASQFSNEDADMGLLMEEYSELNDRFEALGGYSYMHLKDEFVEVFDLGPQLSKTFKQLSGGEKQYIRLAITLFSPSDLVILDEPLSFFDKKKTAWLTKFINESTKAFLVISHSVDFIRSFATKIFNVDNFSVTTYLCGYEEFMKQKKIKIAEEKKYNAEKNAVIEETLGAYEKKLDLLEVCDNKHAQAVILKRMLREIQKLNKEKIEHSPEYSYKYVAPPRHLFVEDRELEGNLLELQNISKSYGDRLLFKDVNLKIEKDSKICIVGENGAGKSTLLKLITGEENPTSGEIIKNPKAKITYIQQETFFHNEKLRITEYLKEVTGLHDDFVTVAVDTLYNGNEEFRDRRVAQLSGGEKKRLEIFASILSQIDLLIIDEPSTYMDDYSRTTIANMLLGFEGAIILITHDKALMRRLNFKTYDIRDRLFREKESSK